MDGGGLMIDSSSSQTLDNDTIYENTAVGNGGNIDNLYTIALANSIVAYGTAGAGADVNNAGTLNSGGYNIIGGSIVGGTYTAGTGDVQHTDPKLLALANNGGPTFTNADQPSSPGTAYIPYSGGNCGTIGMSLDQRGYTRGAGGKCDAGAYEYSGVATAIRHRPHRRLDPRALHGTWRGVQPHVNLKAYSTRITPIMPRSS
jgi:hypothetical protein